MNSTGTFEMLNKIAHRIHRGKKPSQSKRKEASRGKGKGVTISRASDFDKKGVQDVMHALPPDKKPLIEKRSTGAAPTW